MMIISNLQVAKEEKKRAGSPTPKTLAMAARVEEL